MRWTEIAFDTLDVFLSAQQADSRERLFVARRPLKAGFFVCVVRDDKAFAKAVQQYGWTNPVFFTPSVLRSLRRTFGDTVDIARLQEELSRIGEPCPKHMRWEDIIEAIQAGQ